MNTPKIIVRHLELQPGQDVGQAILKSIAEFMAEQEANDASASVPSQPECDCAACQEERAVGPLEGVRVGTLADLLNLFSDGAQEPVLSEETEITEPAEKDLSDARLVSSAEDVSVTQTEDGANIEIRGAIAQEIREKLLDELYSVATEMPPIPALDFLHMLGAMSPETRAIRKLEVQRRAQAEKEKRDLRDSTIGRLLRSNGKVETIEKIIDDLLNQAA